MDTNNRTNSNQSIRSDLVKSLGFHASTGDKHRTPLQKYQDNVIGKRSLWYTIKYEFLTSLLTDLPGMLGLFIRLKLYPLLLGKMGKAVAIGKGVVLWQPYRIFIGDNTVLRDSAFISVRGGQTARVSIGQNALLGRYTTIKTRDGIVEIDDHANIGENCRIGTTSLVKIGSYTMIAANCYIGASNHRFENRDIPIALQAIENKGGVQIGRDVWIGTHVTVADGVTIGDGAIIGAYSLVNKDLPPYAIAYGIPAQIKGKRT